MGSDPSLRQLLTLVIGSVGLGYMLYGRKQAHAVALGCSVLLVVIPFGVNLPALTAVAMLLMVVLPFLLNRFLC
ncbi:amino acid transport protein [Microcystis elabens FACHB-917]|nr:amino acid transport protein [Microcystis elabens FACHB-917]